MKQLNVSKILEYGETAVQLLFLTYTALGFNSITFGTPIISATMWISYLLGAALLLVRLWNWKRYIRTPGLVCLVVMCAVAVVSIGMNLRYDPKRNIIGLIFWIFYFFLYYAQREDMDPELAKKRFRLAGLLMCVFAFVLASVSLVMMAKRYSEILEILGSTVIRGFTHGRLYGAYLTPNGGAVIASIVIFLSVYFIGRYRSIAWRVFAAVNIPVQFLYIVFSDSRSGKLCLTFGAAVYVLFASLASKRLRAGRGKGLIVAALVLATAVGSFYAPKLTQKAYNGLVAAVSQQMAENAAQETVSSQPTDAQTPTEETKVDEQLRQEILNAYQVDRGYDLSGDISNRRFDIWKSGLEIFLRRPWYGTTFSGFLPYALENMPDTYIVSNDYMQMTTLDSDFVNLLVSNGIFGLLGFLAFVVWVLVSLLRKVFAKAYRDAQLPVMMAVCMAAAVYSLFSSGVLYLQAPFSVLFWLSLGSMTTMVKCREKEVCGDAAAH